MLRQAIVGLAIGLASGCARDPGLFVESNARSHVVMLAETIGSRPVGTPANAAAREYIVDRLRQIGFDVRVQETDARRHELGRTARVTNIIAVLPGERPEALALVSHYDSNPDTPGASDGALGVAVALEAARIHATTGRRHWSLFVIVTDGEETGLMGAAALVNDRAVMDRLHAYINVESIGSSGTGILFETGPANGWIVSPWARRAPHPRGGSYALEIYQRLPNDTDFSILKTRDVPGLNFAPVGDSYAYHTARDTADRLTHDTIRNTGENVVSILTALQETDITRRSPRGATFFDIGETVGVSYGPAVHSLLSGLALVLGLVAWVRITAGVVRQNGVIRWVLSLAWAWLGAGVTGAAMVIGTWLLRSSREVYHPWYAHPGRFFIFLILIGVLGAWGMARLGRWLPRRAHLERHPSLTWSATLPVWILLAGLALWFAPAAAYLFVLPLLAAGLLLAPLPIGHAGSIRVASLLVLAVGASLWLRETHDLARFLVTVMGRMSYVTPIAVYAVVLFMAGVILAPPLIGALAADRPLRRPWVVTALLLLATAVSGGAAYVAPPYTAEQPLRRFVRALQETGATDAVWEVASVEPGLDLGPGAPGGWMPTAAGIPASVPWGRFAHPFAFRTTGPSLGTAPVAIAGFTVKPLQEGMQLTLSIVPKEPGLTVSFVLPSGVLPARSNLPGRERLGRWTATFVAPPAEGVAWEASFWNASEEQLRETRVAVTSSRLPGGSGWQSLPAWLPQDTAVWSASATWVVPATAGPAIAPVPPLR
jgi:hypothetical protein